MKILAISAIALGVCDLMAKEAKITRLNQRPQKKVSIPTPRRDQHGELLKKILENNKRLNSLLQTRSSVPVIWEQGAKILTGKVFRGTLLNSIVSTNLSSPLLVLAHPGQGLPPKTKFSCQGVTQNKRVFALCNKMVTPDKETPIQAQILNRDGTSGLMGEYDDSKEELIAGAILSDFSQGVLSAAQSRISSPLGSMKEGSINNQLLQGAIESGRTTSDILLEEMKTQEPIVSIDAGEEILIYFLEALNEN